MNSRPRHARKKESRCAQLLFRAGLTFAATSAVVGGASSSASAAPAHGAGGPRASSPDDASRNTVTNSLRQSTGPTVQALGSSLAGSLGMAKNLRLDPYARTAIDPLNNSVGTSVADFKQVSTEDLTGPLSRGASLGQLPVVGGVSKLLPG